MLEFPKYQWLIPQPVNDCGFCDKLYIPTGHVRRFQVRAIPETIYKTVFNANNYMRPVNFPANYVFDATASVGTTGKRYINSYSFVYESVQYYYVFCYDTAYTATDYKIDTYGNIHIITLSSPPTLNFEDEYKFAFNEYLGFTGAVCTLTGAGGDIVNIAGLPQGTQVDTNEAQFPTVSGLGTATLGLNNFIVGAGEAPFVNISALNFAVSGAPTGTPSIFKEGVVLPINTRILFTVKFTSEFSADVPFKLYVRNNLFAVIDTLSATAKQGTNTLVIPYTTGGTVPASFTFDFGLDDNLILSELIGFAYKEIHIEKIASIGNIYIENCNEVADELLASTITYNGAYNYLIQLDATEIANYDIFRLIIADENSNAITSAWYSVIEEGNCLYGKLYLLYWTNNCNFADLDYTNYEIFDNLLLVSGIRIKQPLLKVEAESNITGSGKKIPIYRHTLEVYEFQLHPYGEQVQELLERVFEHSEIKIDGKKYFADDGAGYAVNEIGDGIYTGTVDLILDGSEVINSFTCCD